MIAGTLTVEGMAVTFVTSMERWMLRCRTPDGGRGTDKCHARRMGGTLALMVGGGELGEAEIHYTNSPNAQPTRGNLLGLSGGSERMRRTAVNALRLIPTRKAPQILRRQSGICGATPPEIIER